MTLSGCHFIYDGTRSSKYGLIFANVETAELTQLSGEKNGVFVENKAMKQRYLVGDDYSGCAMTFDAEIVSCDGEPIELNALKEVERWLFSNSAFRSLYIDPLDDTYGETTEMVFGVQKSLYMNCRFVSPEKIAGNGGVVGFKVTVETDGMMLWQDEITHVYALPKTIVIDGQTVRLLKGDIDFDGAVTLRDAMGVLQAYNNIVIGLDSGLTEMQELVADYNDDGEIDLRDAMMTLQAYESDVLGYPTQGRYIIIDKDTGEQIVVDENASFFDINVDSDIDGYTFPIITIDVGNIGGKITIRNRTDDELRVTEFSGLEGGETVIIDGRTHRVNNGLYEKMTKKHFPRLLGGDNSIILTGDIIQCTVSWQNRRFM